MTSLETVCNNFLTKIYKNFQIPQDWRKCIYYFRSGKNKGTCCQDRALDNGYCKDHQQYATPIVEQVVAKAASSTVAKKATNSKAKTDIETWLNTAVPQAVTRLRKRDGYLVEEDDHFAFSEDYVVIGLLDEKGRLTKITNANLVKKCEEKGWKYDSDAISLEE